MNKHGFYEVYYFSGVMSTAALSTLLLITVRGPTPCPLSLPLTPGHCEPLLPLNFMGGGTAVCHLHLRALNTPVCAPVPCVCACTLCVRACTLCVCACTLYVCACSGYLEQPWSLTCACVCVHSYRYTSWGAVGGMHKIHVHVTENVCTHRP